MTTLANLEMLCVLYAHEREQLRMRVAGLQAAINILKDDALPSIRTAVGEARAAREMLQSALGESAGLFDKPKTRIFSGIKIGYRKDPGVIEIPDEAKTIALIRASVPKAQADLLIRTRESVDKKACGDLTVDDIKRLGMRVSKDNDVPVLKPVDGEVDKLVAALLNDSKDASVDG